MFIQPLQFTVKDIISEFAILRHSTTIMPGVQVEY